MTDIGMYAPIVEAAGVPVLANLTEFGETPLYTTEELAGVGISMNSCWSVNRDIAEGSLVRVLPHYTIDDQSAIWLVYPKSNVLTGKVRVFLDFLIEKIGDPPPWDS